MRNPFHTTRRPATRPEPARWPRSDTPLFDVAAYPDDPARLLTKGDAYDALLAELDLLALPIATGTLTHYLMERAA